MLASRGLLCPQFHPLLPPAWPSPALGSFREQHEASLLCLWHLLSGWALPLLLVLSLGGTSLLIPDRVSVTSQGHPGSQ